MQTRQHLQFQMTDKHFGWGTECLSYLVILKC